MQDQIKEIIEKEISDTDYFLVDLKISGTGDKIAIYLDGDRGITINECGKISRRIGEEIENAEIIDHKYTIEVSSPGAERSLRVKRQYPKNVNRKVQVKTLTQELFEGTLVYVNENEFVLKKDKNFYEFRFSEIEKAKILF